jgi:hypothetical protein
VGFSGDNVPPTEALSELNLKTLGILFVQTNEAGVSLSGNTGRFIQNRAC